MDQDEDTEREIMKRTIALLLSFANMAETVAVRSYLVRCFMLWILRRAMVSAQRYVVGSAAGSSMPWALHRNSRREALGLAQTFRELAHTLQDELRQDQHFSSWWLGRSLPEEPGPDRFMPWPGRVMARPIRLDGYGLKQPAFELPAQRVSPPP